MAVVGRCQLRKLLKKRGLTQTELAELSGKAEAKISDYVNNKSVMSLGTAGLIANILNCHIDDLYEFHFSERQKK
jgi:transcriptional regulator with XRE-family HTH domain